MNLTGIILAGGKSSRMGRDKGLLLFNGKPFISHIIEVLETLVNEIIIVSDNKAYDKFNCHRVDDIMPNLGPLGGIYTGLYHSKSKENIVLSCDIPLITNTVLNTIINHIEDDIDVVQIERNGKIMPLIATYKKRCTEQCLELLNNGERRLRFAVNQFKTKTVTLNECHERYISNINTPEEFESIKSITQ